MAGGMMTTAPSTFWRPPVPVRLLRDCGVFRRGATFRTLDWAISAHDGVWPNGSEWEYSTFGETKRVKIIAGIPVSGNQYMHTGKSTYEWRPR